VIIQLDGGPFKDVLTPVLLNYGQIVEREGRIRAYRHDEEERPLAVIFENDPDQVRREHSAGHDVIWANPDATLTTELACAGDLMRIHLGAQFDFEEVGVTIWRCSPNSAINLITKELEL
jgi:hypothetical protein